MSLGLTLGLSLAGNTVASGSGEFAVSNQSLDIGAETLSGAGGIIPTYTGTPAGNFVISGGQSANYNVNASTGEITPSSNGAATDADTFTWGDGTTSATITINAAANTYHVKADLTELDAAYDAASLSATTSIKVRDGNAQSVSRWTPTARAFTGRLTIEADNWTDNADPRQIVTNAYLPGVSFPASCSNITLQGLDYYDDLTHGELESVGVINVEHPSSGMRIRKNHIHSRDMYAIYDAGEFSNNLSTMNQCRGIAAISGNNTDLHTDFVVEDNYVENCTRGLIGENWVGTTQGDARCNDNHFEHCYNNFTTFGGVSNKLDIIDNRMIHIWASTEDTTGGPGTEPHAAVGLSFDSDPSGDPFQNVRVMGNIASVGWARTKYENDNSDPNTTIAATGMKFNNPYAATSYQNLTIAYNLLISHGISGEIVGGSGADIYNNTLVAEDYTGLTGEPVFSFAGATNLRLWNNISAGYQIGSWDGQIEPTNSAQMGVTMDTSKSYGNINAGWLKSGDLNFENYFVGDGTKGFDLLTVDELEAAYTPIASSHALQATEKKGATGTGYYSGGGSGTAPAYSARAASATNYTPTRTVWDGSTYLRRQGSALSGISDGRYITVGWQGEFDAATDSSQIILIDATGLKVNVKRLAVHNIRFRLENAAGGVLLEADTDGELFDSSLGQFAIVFAADTQAGVVHCALNGEPLPLEVKLQSAQFGDIDLDGATTWTVNGDQFGADIFQGTFDAALMMDEYADVTTSAGLSTLFATNGLFKDWGADGSSITAGAKPIVIRGQNAAAINGGTSNGGDGGAFSVVGGTVTDESAPPTDIMAGIGDFASATGWALVGTDAPTISGGVLVFNTSSNFNDAQRVGGNRVSCPANTTLSMEFNVTAFTSFAQMRVLLRSYNSGGAGIDSQTVVWDSNSDGNITGTGLVTKASLYTTPANTDTVEVVIQALLSGTDLSMDDFKLTY